MAERTWQEYGTPGTPVLNAKDVEQAEARLETVWQDAKRRTREVEVDRSNCDERSC